MRHRNSTLDPEGSPALPMGMTDLITPPTRPLTGPGSSTRTQRLLLLLGVSFVVWAALRLFASILLPFVLSAGIAYFLDPVVSKLARVGVRRSIAALAVLVLLFTGVLIFLLLLYPLIIAQVGILAARVPSYAAQLQHWAEVLLAHAQDQLGTDIVDAKLRELVSGQAGAMVSFLLSAVTSIVGSGFALFNVLSLLVVTPVVSFYLLRDWPGVISRIDQWLPRRYEDVVRAQANEVDRILAAWVRGQAICCVLLALFYAIALSLVGLDLGLIVGISAGLLSFIPYVGTITGGVTSIGLALAQFPDWHGVARVAAVFFVGQMLEGYVIYPRFLGDRVELHAVWVIFALFAGGAAFGFLGVLLAVPTAATIGVLARFWLRRYMDSPLYLDPPDHPASVTGRG